MITLGEYTDRSTWMRRRGVLSIHQSSDQSGSRLKLVVCIIMTSDKQHEEIVPKASIVNGDKYSGPTPPALGKMYGDTATYI